MQLTFISEALANTALAQINTNYGYPVVGVNAQSGKPDPTAQPTTAWATAKKAYELDKWFFSKPAADKMTGVADYAEEEFNEDWNEPVEE